MAVTLPAAFTARMEKLLGEEYKSFLDSYEETRKYALRVNTLKISADEFERIAPFHLTRVPWVEGAYYYEEEDAPGRHPFYYAGLYYLQEPSAMTPAAILHPTPGQRVLDLCAAPGGKATALGAMLAGEGLLAANDISTSRCKALLKNLELFGIANAFVLNAVPAKLTPQFREFFDCVLLDAPCSGEGMFRKDEHVRRVWNPEKNAQCAAIQKDLVLEAADMLRPGGRMLYSTCTFAPEENEEVVRHLLNERPSMHLVYIPDRKGFSRGLYGLEECVRLWPHVTGGEGHFLAYFQKDDVVNTDNSVGLLSAQQERGGSASKGCTARKQRQKSVPETDDTRLTDFFDQTCVPSGKIEKWMKCIRIQGTQVYFNTAYQEESVRVPFLRNGLYAGELKKDRFEPSQELAMALSSADFRHYLNLVADDERIFRYLRGETITCEPDEICGVQAKAVKGWLPVCVEGFPLGWSKAGGGLLKNKYHPGWRI